MQSPFAKELWRVPTSTPRCEIVQTDEWKMTSVNGVYAAGDMSRMTHGIPLTTADGATPAMGAHQSLISEEE
jgi:thioredoxin reductase